MKYGKIINGDYYYKNGDDLSGVEKISGSVYVRANAKLSLPNCSSIGGYVEQ